MSHGWTTGILDDVCNVEYGTRVVRKRDGGSGFPVYGGGGPTFEMDAPNREDRVVVARFGMSERCTRYVEDKFFLNDSGLTLSTKNPERLSQKFLDAWTVGANDRIYRLGKGSAQRNLDVEALRRLSIPIPSMEEQQRIVRILDEAFAGIAAARDVAERNRADAQAVFDRELNNVFTSPEPSWSITAVSEMADCSLGKMLDRSRNRGQLKPYLRNLNVRWFEFALDDVQEMRFLPAETERYTIARGDVVVCEGGYPGRAAIWTDAAPMYFQKALHRVRFHDPAYAEWFVLLLYSRHQSGALAEYCTGTGIQHFTGAALARFPVPVPSSRELSALLKNLKAIQASTAELESVYHSKLAALDELKQSLLHHAFTGQL